MNELPVLKFRLISGYWKLIVFCWLVDVIMGHSEIEEKLFALGEPKVLSTPYPQMMDEKEIHIFSYCQDFKLQLP